MPNHTRRVHVVRVYDQDGATPGGAGNTDTPYVDVKVIDCVALQTASGDELLFEVMDTDGGNADDTGDNTAGSGAEERLYDVSAVNAVPAITDNTGDGNGKGVSANTTRATHMKRLTSQTDDTQFFDAEILDAFALQGPDGSEIVFNMPTSGINEAVVDPTGNNLGVAPSPSTTRSSHVMKVIAEIESTNSDGVTSVTQDPSNSLLVKVTDAIAFQGPNSQEFVLYVPSSAASENDTTVYSLDAAGQKKPPANTDPDPYVFFPSGAQGPFLGVKTPVDQGLLWHIVGTGIESSKKKPGPAGTFDITLTVTTTGSISASPLTFQLANTDQTISDMATVGPSGGKAVTINLTITNVSGDVFLNIYSSSGGANIDNDSFVTCWASFTASLSAIPPETIVSPISPNVGKVEPSSEYVAGSGDIWVTAAGFPSAAPFTKAVCPISLSWTGPGSPSGSIAYASARTVSTVPSTE